MRRSRQGLAVTNHRGGECPRGAPGRPRRPSAAPRCLGGASAVTSPASSARVVAALVSVNAARRARSWRCETPWQSASRCCALRASGAHVRRSLRSVSSDGASALHTIGRVPTRGPQKLTFGRIVIVVRGIRSQQRPLAPHRPACPAVGLAAVGVRRACLRQHGEHLLFFTSDTGSRIVSPTTPASDCTCLSATTTLHEGHQRRRRDAGPGQRRRCWGLACRDGACRRGDESRGPTDRLPEAQTCRHGRAGTHAGPRVVGQAVPGSEAGQHADDRHGESLDARRSPRCAASVCTTRRTGTPRGECVLVKKRSASADYGFGRQATGCRSSARALLRQ